MPEISVTHEPASQRLHYRVSAPAVVIIDGTQYPTVDWSIGGFLIERYAGEAKALDRLKLEFTLDFQGFAISFPAEAEVVRREGSDRLAGKFIALGERETSLLKHFVSSLMSGQVSAIDGVLKNIDRPVTKVPLTQPAEPANAIQRRIWKRVFFSVTYLAAGLALGWFVYRTITELMTKFVVETAVTAMQLEQIVAIEAGAIRDLHAKPGDIVKAGDLLMRVESEIASRNIDLARKELSVALAELGQTRRMAEQEKGRMGAYQVIGINQQGAQAARIKSIEAARAQAIANFERSKQLWLYGLVSRTLYDADEAKVKQHDAELEQAQKEMKIIETSNGSIERGFFFSGNYLVGDMQQRVGEEQAAMERAKGAEAALKDATRYLDRHDYRAPFDAVILRVFKSPGMTLDRGEAAIVLRRMDEQAHVDAYLNQQDAGTIVHGMKGTALLVATGKSYSVEVVEVDRTAGFLKDIQTPKLVQPQWSARNLAEKTAYVRLIFVGVSPEELTTVKPGWPVQLTFTRKMDWTFGLLQGVKAAEKVEMKLDRFWPKGTSLLQKDLPRSLLDRVMAAARKARSISPAPVETLHSAGVADQSAPDLIASRRALQDADSFLSLALAYRLSSKPEYHDAAQAIVVAWARVHKPTGQPIDETRLEGFLWGLDLIGVENSNVSNWLLRWWEANHAYHFGPRTEFNNHQTHHLKIALMLDRLLGRDRDYKNDLKLALKHEKKNLGSSDGMSLDYQERDAMHYHIFDLEAWTEIALLTGCCQMSIERAFGFFDRQMKEHPQHVEFTKSTAAIDQKRAKAGFNYVQSKPYDRANARRAMWSRATLLGGNAPAVEASPATLFYEARYYLWR